MTPAAWSNESVIEHWLKVIWRRNSSNRRLLIWDAFSAHKTDKIKEKVGVTYNSDMAVIPGGCTSKLQPCDTEICNALDGMEDDMLFQSDDETDPFEGFDEITPGEAEGIRQFHENINIEIDAINEYSEPSDDGDESDDSYIACSFFFQVIFQAFRGTNYHGHIAIDDIMWKNLDQGSPCSSTATKCDFEDGSLCGFTEQDNALQWSVRTQGPLADHTYGTIYGHYLTVLMNTTRKIGKKASMTSQSLPATNADCMSFYYHNVGGRFSVYMKTVNTINVIFRTSGNTQHSWELAEAAIQSTSNYNLVVEWIQGSASNSSILVDDIQITPGMCPIPGNCDFEKYGMCTWSNVKTVDQFDWLIDKGQTRSNFIGPSFDHTLEMNSGHYLLMSVDNFAGPGATSRVESLLFPPTVGSYRCFHFWYHMLGSDIGTLTVYVKSLGKLSTRWQLGDNQQDQWWHGQLGIESNTPYSIVIEGRRGTNMMGDIALDDLSFTNGNCAVEPSYADPQKQTTVSSTSASLTTSSPSTPGGCLYDCDFEHGLCSWQQVNGSDDDFDWWRAQGPWGSNVTGPIMDHTKNNERGWYVYIPVPPSTETREQRAQIIFLEGGRSEGASGVIAVDDIRLSNGSCSYPENPTFCDFESRAQCNYTSMNKGLGQPMWIWMGTDKMVVDHTLGTSFGHFMFLLVSKDNETQGNSTGALVSPMYPADASGASCLQFYYMIYGSGVGSLSVYSVVDGNRQLVWTRSYDEERIWRKGYTSVYTSHSFQAMFEGAQGQGKTDTRIAVDDLQLNGQPCSHKGFCDFEIDTCDWINMERSDDFDWLRSGGRALGPSLDHTLGTTSGHFMYISMETQRGKGDAAVLASDVFPKSHGPMCLTFFYYMSGEPQAGELNVKVKTNPRLYHNQQEATLWTLIGSSGPQWFQGQVAIHTQYTDRTYQILFEALYGSSGRGVIAIDDITMYAGDCNIIPSYADSISNAPASVACGFETRERCQWTSVSLHKNSNWTISGSAENKTDFLIGHNRSGFSYLDVHDRTREGITKYISPLLSPTSIHGNCFRVWYHMQGPHVGTLNIHVDASNLVWTRSGPHRQQWKMAAVTINSAVNYMIVIEGATPSQFEGSIAIDDISMDTVPCHSSNLIDIHNLWNCDFETDLCGWKLPFSSASGRVEVRNNNRTDAPTVDHTTETRYGHYFNTLPSTDRIGFPLLSPNFPPTEGICLQFWYYTYQYEGLGLGLMVNVNTTDDDNIVWRANDPVAETWIRTRMTVKSTKPYAISIFSFLVNAGIDDMAIFDAPCTPPGYCDFANGLCGYSNGMGNDFDWIVQSGQLHNGPTHDHTSNSIKGHYAIAEAVFDQSAGDTARLQSELIPQTNGSCLYFWYMITGTGFEDIRVHIRSGQNSSVVFMGRNQSNPAWRDAQIPIVHNISTFLIIFEAVRSGQAGGSISLDDVKLVPGDCKSANHPLKKAAIFDAPCPPAGCCGFESGLCGYSNAMRNDFDWVVQSGQSLQSHDGPIHDHTSHSIKGHYAMAEAVFNQLAGARAILESEIIPATNSSCLSFSYMIIGTGIGVFKVHIQSGGNDSVVLTATEQSRQSWKNVEIPIFHNMSTFLIEFEAIRSNETSGSVSLDDVKLITGDCKSPPSETAAVTSLSCNFEAGMCGWANVNRTSGPPWRAVSHMHDWVDHTTMSKSGKFAASIISPLIEATNACVSFWYDGTQQYDLRVKVVKKGQQDTVVWTSAAKSHPLWKYITVDFSQSPDTSAKILFEATLYTTPEYTDTLSAIGLDDIRVINTPCPQTRTEYCDFQQGMCGFQQDEDNPFKWVDQEASSASIKGDHTYGVSRYGRVLHANMTGATPGQKSTVRSHSYSAGPRCVTFWYYMLSGSMNVYVVSDTTLSARLTWSGQGDLAPDWKIAQIDVSSDVSYQVVYEALAVTGHSTEVVALDDINASYGQCEGMGNCDFEGSNTCAWMRGSKQRNRMMVADAAGYMPYIDHTLGTGYGHFLRFVATHTGIEHEYFNLNSQWIEPAHPDYCFTFWYFVGHEATSSMSWNISAYFRYPNSTQQNALIDLPTSQTTNWQQARANFHRPSDKFQLVIMASSIGVLDYNSNNFVAIDDLRLDGESCTQEPQLNGTFTCSAEKKVIKQTQVCDFMADCDSEEDEMNCGTCDFELNMCSWRDQSSGKLKWSSGSNVSTVNGGPLYDHTTGITSGHYVYLNSNNGSSLTGGAMLTGPLLQASSSTCQLQFWYYMYGKNAGTLKVMIEESSVETEVWEKIGSQADKWIRAVVDIGRVHRPFTVSIVMMRVFSSSGKLALDDFTLLNCNYPSLLSNCGGNSFNCSRGACVPTSRVCDYTDDCGDNSDEINCSDHPGRCDFAYGLDSWQQEVKRDRFDWKIINGKTGTYGTGPTRDHTTGTSLGNYLYIESSSPRIKGDNAWLLSLILKPTQNTSDCTLRFFYHMYGDTVGSLNVYTRTSLLGPMTKIWGRSGNVGDFFERIDLPLKAAQAFQVVIEGVVGDGYRGDIAIDDVSLTPGCRHVDVDQQAKGLPEGTQVNVTTPSPCGEGAFMCKNDSSVCLPSAQVCDFKQQCSDASDEENCGSCTFDGGQCGWKDVSTGRTRWNLHKGRSLMTPKGRSSMTVTHNSINGAYMRVEHGVGVYYTEAVMESSVLQATAPSCVMSLNYYLYNVGVGTLRVTSVNTLNGNDRSILWSTSGSQGDQWQSTLVDISQLDAGHKIQIEAFSSDLGSPDMTSIAVDNIHFLDCDPDVIYMDASTNCTFESNWCDYFNGKGGDFNWARTNMSTPTAGTGPDRDHTTGTGYYIYMETSQRRRGQKALLTTGLQKPTDSGGVCFSFWYHMFGVNVNTLNIYFQPTHGKQQLIWTRSDNHGNIWKLGHAAVHSQTPYQIIIEGTVGSMWLGDIALDDILVTNGACPASKTCDFEVDLCGWTNNHATLDTEWSRHSNTAGLYTNGPIIDHTTENRNGHYLYVGASLMQAAKPLAQIISPEYPPSVQPECLQFWYYMYGRNIGEVSVSIRVNGLPDKLVWNETGREFKMWLYHSVTVRQTTPWQIVIEGGVSNGGIADMAFDDITVRPGSCTPIGSCDFEFGTCGFFNTHSNDNFDWSRTAGRTLLPNTGPEVDHTTNSDRGFYMYITAAGHHKGQRSFFYSPFLQPTSASCLTFWYFMFGDNVEALRVYQPTPHRTISLWNITGNQGFGWKQASINIQSTVEFQLTFDGEVGNGFLSDIAIDDISYTQGACADLTTPAPTTPYTPSTYPPTNLDCDFENNNTCNWQEDLTMNFNWTLQQGPSSNSNNTGPSYDHTTMGSLGHYITTRAVPSAVSTYNTAHLVGPDMQIGDSGKCIKFWYHMYGSHVNNLSVYAMQGNGLDQPVWQKTGNQGDSWIFGTVFLPSQNTSTVKIVFEAVAGFSHQGNIAIDDISVNDGVCPPTDDCDFESVNTCGYYSDIYGDFQWTRGGPIPISLNKGPYTDHTYGTLYGHYMHLNGRNGSLPGTKARLMSQTYPPTTGRCMSFFYQMYGQTSGTLNVYILYQGREGLPASWSQAGNLAGRGKQLLFLSIIVLEGIRGTDSTGDIAIDDISISDGFCPTPGSCDFEQGKCTWSNDRKSDDFDWIRQRGYTEYGPSVDHTLGSEGGHYMYIEPRPGRNGGDKARLKSEVFRAQTGRCLSFYYAHQGADLAVYIDTFGSQSAHKKLWSITSSTPHYTWKQAQVTIDSPFNDFQLVIEGVIAQTGVAFVSVDDIRFLSTPCSGPTKPAVFTCTSGDDTLLPDYVCDFVPNCANGHDEIDCGDSTFESGTDHMNGWRDTSRGSFRWTRHKKSDGTSVFVDVPAVDHTTNSSSGHYMMVETWTSMENVQATLESPLMHEAAATCTMSLYYNVVGTSAGDLSVRVQNGNGIQSEIGTVWRLPVAAENSWQHASIQIGRQLGAFKVVIFGESRTIGKFGYIAVDDFHSRIVR
ncbi:hypothetical protein ScPMuIL_015177 [Solemya velum]